MNACPCCGWRAEEKGVTEISSLVKLTDMERRIFNVFARRFGRLIDRDILAASVYSDDADGGPLYADNSIAVIVGHIRKKIEPYGLTIEGMKGRGSRGRRMIWTKTGRTARK